MNKKLDTMFIKKVTFLVNIIMYIIIVLPTMTAASDDDVYLLATALYGTSAQGKHLLIHGPLPSAVVDIIESDMKRRINPKANIKVVPLFQNTTSFQDDDKDDNHENILQMLRSYSNILKADLSEMKSRKSYRSFWYHIIGERKRHREQKEKAEAAKGKDKEEPTTMQTHFAKVTAPLKSKPNDYYPNDIYYGIEKKCANWADGCDLKSPSILEMSSKYFKPVGFNKPPLRLIW